MLMSVRVRLTPCSLHMSFTWVETDSMVVSAGVKQTQVDSELADSDASQSSDETLSELNANAALLTSAHMTNPHCPKLLEDSYHYSLRHLISFMFVRSSQYRSYGLFFFVSFLFSFLSLWFMMSFSAIVLKTFFAKLLLHV